MTGPEVGNRVPQITKLQVVRESARATLSGALSWTHDEEASDG
jgi:hypothetical protein